MRSIYLRPFTLHPFPFTLVFLLCLILAACGGGGGDGCVVVTVTVTPDTPSAAIGSTVQFTAVARDADGNICGSVTFIWSSSDDMIASIDSSGLATMLSTDMITITATASGTGMSGVATLTVTLVPTFGAATEFGLGGVNPQALVIGQFDISTPDTSLDVAVANQDTGDVSILLGDGLGGLPFVNIVSTSEFDPVSIAQGSFDSGVLPDLAVVNFNFASNNVTILLGDGLGSFDTAPPPPVSVGTSPQSVAAGDFNNDGSDDLAVANFLVGDITILMSNGDGTFATSTVPLPGSFGPFAVAAGLIDGDPTMNLDLAVADLTDNSIWILLGNGDGTFTPVPPPFPAPPTDPTISLLIGTGPAAIAIADFNDPGIFNPDLAIVNVGLIDDTCTLPPTAEANKVTILLGDGLGSFPFPPITYPVGLNPRAIATGDFNQDGAVDLVTANFCSDDITLLTGIGDGTFPIASSFSVEDPLSPPPPNRRPTGVAVGDLDISVIGFPDVAVSNSGTDTVSVLLNAN